MQKETSPRVADLEDKFTSMEKSLCLLWDHFSSLVESVCSVNTAVGLSAYVRSDVLARMGQVEKFQEDLKGFAASSLVLRASLQSLSSLSSV